MGLKGTNNRICPYHLAIKIYNESEKTKMHAEGFYEKIINERLNTSWDR